MDARAYIFFLRVMLYIFIDYTMAKVVSSCISARPCCILQRVIGLVHIARRPQVKGDKYKTHHPRENTIKEG